MIFGRGFIAPHLHTSCSSFMGKILGFVSLLLFLLKAFLIGALLFIFTFSFIRTIYPGELTLSVVQESAIVIGITAIIFAAIQAYYSSKTYKHTVTPILLHTGFFDFFDAGTRPKNLVLASFKNMGERLCYNVHGWCVNKNKLHRLVFGEILSTESNGNSLKTFKADFKRVWMGKGNEINATINKPAFETIPDSLDHLLLFYQDNEGDTYFSLLTRSYTYSTGKIGLMRLILLARSTRIPFFKLISLINISKKA